MNHPIFHDEVLLEKFSGKGGWTYAALPTIKPDSKNPFGWVKVKGFIDEYYFDQYHLMPMGNGKLFLPVKAVVRKKIRKEAGQLVEVKLYLDNDPVNIPGELLECLRDAPEAHEAFFKLTDNEKVSLIKYIYEAKQEDTRVERITRLLKDLEK